MNNVLSSITESIGNTPLIELKNINNQGHLFAKMEFIQPGGSIKDRAALRIIQDAYADNRLKKGQTVVEMTSGNMGAGLAIVCLAYRNPFIAVMSAGNSPERIKILEALGAKVLLIPQADGSPGKVTGSDINKAIEKAKLISQEKGAFYVDQFNNYSGISAHYSTTGPEIWKNSNGRINAFVSAIGSGCTFIGTSMFLKEQKSKIICAAVEPKNAAILRTGHITDSKHIIQGTGYGIIPPLWKKDLADEIITVSDDEAIRYTKALAKDEGLYVGYSSGANVCAGLKLIKSNKLGKNPVVVTVLCDTAYKYSDL